MIGAGVFAAIGPAARVAGAGLLVGLAIGRGRGVLQRHVVGRSSPRSTPPRAAPTSTAANASAPFWGYLAGWGFVVGKTASCAGDRPHRRRLRRARRGSGRSQSPPSSRSRPSTTAASARPPRLTRVIVAVVARRARARRRRRCLRRPRRDRATSVTHWTRRDHGILQSAGLLFFAFAGYARIATLGEEVDDPARTIPKSHPPRARRSPSSSTPSSRSARSPPSDPLHSPGRRHRSRPPCVPADLDVLAPAVRVGGAVAALGVLLSLIAGVSRTAFAMAADGELPRWLDAVHPTHKVPHRADWPSAASSPSWSRSPTSASAIGFSSFCVLTYYAIANASAWTLPPERRHWPRAFWPAQASSAASRLPSPCPPAARRAAVACSPSAQ